MQKYIEGFDYEIIIVNDGDKIDLNAFCWVPNLLILQNPSKGAASARNYGAKHAQGDYLLFLDDDMLLTEGAIETLLCYAQEHPMSCFNINWEIPPILFEQIQKTKFGKFLIAMDLPP